MEELRLWLPSLIAAATLFWAIIVANRSARRSEVVEQSGEIEKAKVEIADVKSRLSAAEMSIRHLPDKDSSHRLEMAIARLEGRMETMDERLKPVAIMAARVQERMFEEQRS